MQTNTSYILFLQAYIPGIKDAAGTYVTTQANQGIYRFDKNGTFTEYNIEGQSTPADDRTNKFKVNIRIYCHRLLPKSKIKLVIDQYAECRIGRVASEIISDNSSDFDVSKYSGYFV